MERYICIHGHFYQPPRENAWLEEIETQDSAYPYHDWNEKVTAECYAPNTASRILGDKDYIAHILNNYTKISFNFGPTLLSWMENKAPDVYRAILEADRQSQQTFSGHGSAMAQAYNHLIMPLANHRDKYTQVLWGIRDFEHRFGRKPEGMWLPETAVDLETLDIMAEQGIKFTILAPHQARRVRQLGTRTWHEVSNSDIDSARAYEIKLPSGRRIALFFYFGSIAHNVAFGDLLDNGDNFAHRLVEAFTEKRDWSQLVHIAADGETYGHHHRFGDMALAFALHHIEEDGLAKITNYGEFLEKHPPTYEVEVNENTSWSCVHGIERWRSDCGCNAGREAKWNQAWRAPLRETMDWLRDALIPEYEAKASGLLKDPWAARNDYIEVMLERSPENVQLFLARHCTRELNESETITVLKLLELQRHALLMYTSCGWFFDELSGIETVQVIQYAGRAVQLAQELFGDDFESHFLELLELARSNIPEHGDGHRIYDKFVKPEVVDLTRVAVHFAVNSMFEDYGQHVKIYSYGVDLEDYQSYEDDKLTLAAGRVKVTSSITGESATLSFGVLHLGGHHVSAGIRNYQGEEAYQTMLRELTQAFSSTDFPEIIQLLNKHFGTSTYSIKNLFSDERREVLNNILESALSEVEAAYYQVYGYHYPPMRFLSESGPIPKGFQSSAGFILNSQLRKAVGSEKLDWELIRSLLVETQTWKVELDVEGLSYLLQHTMENMMVRLLATPEDIGSLQALLTAAQMLPILPFPIDPWRMQILYLEILKSIYPGFQARAQRGDAAAVAWLSQFVALGEKLSIKVS